MDSTSLRLPARALGVLRAEGIGALRLRVLDATIYRRLNVYSRSLQPAHAPRPVAGAEFSLLAAAEADAYRRLRPDTPAAEVRRRLGAGQICMVARLGGELVHARWSSTDRLESPYLGFAFELRPGIAYSHDAFTARGARRLGIAIEATRRNDVLLAAAGARVSLAGVWPGNAAAIALFETLDRTPIGSLATLRLGRRRRLIRRLADGYVGAARRFTPAPGAGS